MKGATRIRIQDCLDLISFNPRAREGRDTALSVITTTAIIVSIHAPVKGATFGGEGLAIGFKSFNPRAREGRDLSQPVTV